MPHRLYLLPIVLLAFSLPVFGYQWPDPRMNDLEHFRWDQQKAAGRGVDLSSEEVPCNSFIRDVGPPPQVGRTNAADWLRTVGYMFSDVVSSDR
jgi:hypothetical protein